MTTTYDALSRRALLGMGATSLVAGMGVASLGPVSGAEPPAPPAGGANPSTAGKPKHPCMAADFTADDGRDVMSHAIHDGEEEGFSCTPIYQPKNVRGGYQRPGDNPTLHAFLGKIRSLEGAEDSVGAACGMSAVSQTFLSFLGKGERIIVHRCNYDNVTGLLDAYLPKWGVEVVRTDFNDLNKVREAVQASKVWTMVWFEPYVNPTMEILDAPAIIKTAKEAGANLVGVDNTWLTPYLFRPLKHGADVVVHSATKYINGHGNAMGGVVSGSKKHIVRIRETVNKMGGLLRPFDAFLATQGLKTLPMRMERHCSSAQTIAEFLETNSAVARVRYAGLSSWERQKASTFLKGHGGMIGVEWKDGKHHKNFPHRLKMCKPWTSLGDIVTLVSTRSEETSRGIPQRYTRISIGLEDPDDIIADFRQAIDKC